MAISDADTISLCRALYPAVTTDAASDAYLSAWLPWARSLTGAISWGADYDRGVAMLLAHRAYVGDPAGLLGGAPAGPLRSLSTLGMSVGMDSPVRAGAGGLSLALATTQPGRDYLAVQATLATYVLPHVSY
jgi:hypothetical protein